MSLAGQGMESRLSPQLFAEGCDFGAPKGSLACWYWWPCLCLGLDFSAAVSASLLTCPALSSAAVAVVNEDVHLRQYLMCGQTAQVKMKNVVPHDIGDPGEGCIGPVGEQRRCQAVGN